MGIRPPPPPPPWLLPLVPFIIEARLCFSHVDVSHVNVSHCPTAMFLKCGHGEPHELKKHDPFLLQRGMAKRAQSM